MRVCKTSKWTVPVLSVVLGAAVCAAEILGGNAGVGLYALGAMIVFAAVFAFGGRSETIRGLRGDGRDERFHAMDMRATLAAGNVLLIAVLVAWVVTVANGHSGAPYDWLAAIAGMTYIARIVWLRLVG